MSKRFITHIKIEAYPDGGPLTFIRVRVGRTNGGQRWSPEIQREHLYYPDRLSFNRVMAAIQTLASQIIDGEAPTPAADPGAAETVTVGAVLGSGSAALAVDHP